MLLLCNHCCCRYCCFSLLQEYCDLGTLRSVAGHIHAEQGEPLPGQLLSVESKLKLLLLLRDVASGLKALHDQQTIHGDLVSNL